MEFTGERMIPEYNYDEEIYLEHMSRYIFASQFIKDKVTLDIACGSGYGTDFLSKEGARRIIGIDISNETINYCKEKYSHDNISFLIGNVENIPIKNNEIDVIISMETIEHVDEKAQLSFISEISRIMKNDGVFIVSTPNSLVYPKGNPFHVKEMNPIEFISTLQKKFNKVNIFYQDNVESNYIMSESSLNNNFTSSKSNFYAKNLTKLDPTESMYLIAVCSNLDLKQSENEYVTVFKTRMRELYSEINQKGQIILGTQTQLTSTQTQLAETQSNLTSTQTQLAETQSNLTSTQTQLTSTQTQLAETQSNLTSTQTQLTSTQSELIETKARLTSTESQLSESRSQLSETQSQLASTKNQADFYAKELGAIYSSRLWKLGLTIHKLKKIVVPRDTTANLRRLVNKPWKMADSEKPAKMLYNDPLDQGNEAGFEGILDKHNMTLQADNDNLLTQIIEFGFPKFNKILVVDRSLPTHDKDSGSQRMFNFLKILRELDFEVVFFPEDPNIELSYFDDLIEMNIEIVLNDLEFYLKEKGCEFSFAVLSRPDQAHKFLPIIRAYAINAKVFYDTVDLHWLRLDRESKILNDPAILKESENYKKIEIANCLSADVVLTVTPDEKNMLQQEIPNLKIDTLPNIHEIYQNHNGFENRNDLMFIGGFMHRPNVDAVLYFVKEIFPIIKKELPEIKFFAVGSYPPPEITNLNSTDIIIPGYVKNVDSYFLNSKVFVSPLRYGAGMKGKIGHSMSFGLPVVTTSIGAEGMNLKNDENAIITDNSMEFAESVLRIYKDENLWEKLSKNSIDHIEKNYSMNVLKKQIIKIFK